MEVSEYHGGSQRGSLRIPEGRQGVGWALFDSELRKYFLAKHDSSVPPPGRGGSYGGERAPVTGFRRERNGRISNSQNLKESRDSRRRNKVSAHSESRSQSRSQSRELRRGVREKGVNLRVIMSTSEPRPTRKFEFRWEAKPNTIRITKTEGRPREVSWVGLNKNCGPTVISGTNPLEPTPLEAQPIGSIDSVDLVDGSQKLHFVSREVQSETSLMEDTGSLIGVASGDVTTGVPEEELRPDLGGEEAINDMPGSSTEAVRVDLAEHIQVADVLGGHDRLLALDVNHGQVGFPLSVCLEPEYNHTSELLPITDLPELEAEALSPLVCEPLAIIEPAIHSNVASGPSGEFISKELESSKRVNRQYRGICKLVGFPIDTHEQECLDLLRRIEASRESMKRVMGPRKVTFSGLKGTRELKNLATSVNYEGKRGTR